MFAEAPVSPLSPRGIVKLKTAALVVPMLATLALVPGAPVVVVPTLTVAAGPCGPAGPAGPEPPSLITSQLNPLSVVGSSPWLLVNDIQLLIPALTASYGL